MATSQQLNNYPFPIPEGGQLKPWDLSITLIILFCVVVIFPLMYISGKKARNNQKIMNYVPFSIGLFLIITEIYKQIIVTYHFNWEYHYNIFPFQLCSVPMYTSFLIPFIKNQRTKDYLFAFMAQYGMLGGMAVLLMQGSVLTWEDYSLDYHSIIWHCLLVALGIFGATYLNYGKSNYKHTLKLFSAGTVVFISVLALAELINFVIILNHGYNETTRFANMFYISMFVYNLNVPILNSILAELGWYMGLVTYCTGIILGGLLFASIYYWFARIRDKINEYLNSKKQEA